MHTLHSRRISIDNSKGHIFFYIIHRSFASGYRVSIRIRRDDFDVFEIHAVMICPTNHLLRYQYFDVIVSKHCISIVDSRDDGIHFDLRFDKFI
ncbi:hypothetical protein NY2A_b315R [Paramecium bursaria Chlorella virus NY2A]|uniref:Uncharacterized protein b315R n=1 Tax=Paramecium bursaria Chlorella virus NY2A TaxID=46021 RepID=A7IWJ0_PBCVN|nr:hypothetical protein NY2A_b315R [Paramecium bursaria Chlorella virus NY2A]YP_001498372.1 hypothetical protein AR158_c291R [Paramecium bursaria Chlorella virus AR158]ABT14714.1 hypothetical protein NY2A_b315R [Paramecium bursaria Chlorella virus NY2A]ABU43836.1 hypothetical protein AR158_c291R [Paramecium bursaria Chlorella virus AR158]